MNNFRRKIISSLVFVIAAPAWIYGQQSLVPSWQTITMGEVSVALPAGFLVYKREERNETLLAAGAPGAAFEVRYQKIADAAETLKSMQKSAFKPKGEASTFRVGKTTVYQFLFNGNRLVQYSLHLATKRGLYRIIGSASSRDNESLGAFLSSLKLSHQPVVTRIGDATPASTSEVDSDSLRSSDPIRAALERKQVEKIEIGPVSADVKESDADTFYDRPLLMLWRDRPRYTDAARQNNIQGTVLLRITFRGDGQLGKIWVVSGLPHGLTEEAIKVAKTLTFLPAQVQGRGVDVIRDVDYGFAIY